MHIRFAAALAVLAFVLMPASPVGAVEPARMAPPKPEEVQASIDGGVRWLLKHQVKEGPEAGSWPSRYYHSTVASFGGLALLANGYLPGRGKEGEAIDRAMKFVMAGMAPDGYLGQGSRTGMYSHAICTLFGLTYLGMSEEPEREAELAEWCRKALNVIIEAQQVRRESVARGGWRYTPGTTESDVSVTSWQLLVLHAARQCGYRIDQSIFDAGLRYVNSAYVEVKLQKNDPEPTGGFIYRPRVSKVPEPGSTGTAVFIKSLFERHQDEKIERALEFLQRFPPSWGGPQYNGYFYFASFYMAQGIFQIGGEAWEEWRPQLQRVLIRHQSGDGSWPLPPDNAEHSRLTGPAYPTAMAVLILSLDKQALPMYQRQKQLF